MKILLKALLPGLMLFCVATSCTNDTVSPSGSNLSIPDDDAWRITRFWDKDKDETSDFADYLFYFRADNVLEAVGTTGSTSGTWNTGSDDSTQRLILSISPNKPLSELNDDWVITESTANVIRLHDDNDTHLEELLFERIQ
jgi:hypothetical protein